MFQVGDKVVYSIHGVCEVAAVEEVSIVMGLDTDEAKKYIRSKLQN